MFKNNIFNVSYCVPYLHHYYSKNEDLEKYTSELWTRAIFELKRANSNAIDNFCIEIEKHLSSGACYVCPVPSSEPGIDAFARKLENYNKARVYRRLLDDVPNSPRQHEKKLTLKEKKETLIVNPCILDKNIPILIIDDIATTNTTLVACKQKLEEAYPENKVYIIALLKTATSNRTANAHNLVQLK